MAPKDTAGQPKLDAFAMMRAAAAGKKAQASAGAQAADEPASSSRAAAGTSKTAAGSESGSGSAGPAPIFKPRGSGLGAGPKHTIDPENQPWVEK